MKKAALLLATVLFAVPAFAGFDEVESALRGQLGSSRWIPFFGVARTFIRVTHPDGVHDVQLAVFEGKGPLDGAAAERLMAQRVGRGFTPMVRSRSHREWTSIYARPSGKTVELVILTNDGDDTVLVRVVADPDAVSEIAREDGHVRFTHRD